MDDSDAWPELVDDAGPWEIELGTRGADAMLDREIPVDDVWPGDSMR